MNKILNISIPIGIGDILHIKAQLDKVKYQFEQINITFEENFFIDFRSSPIEYKNFIIKFSNLIFSEFPYKIVPYNKQNFRNCTSLCNVNKIQPQRPFFKNKLCAPINNIYGQYITLSTKIRELNYDKYIEIKDKYFNLLNKYSNKYKLMILGEREIEYNSEYHYHGNKKIYSIYDDYINKLPKDKIIDLTIPALGITSPTIEKLLYDCSLMGNAAYNFVLGIGGNFCLAISIGNTVGYRADDDHIADILYTDKNIYGDIYITKNSNNFFNKLEEIYLR